jgi:hypothetical protein
MISDSSLSNLDIIPTSFILQFPLPIRPPTSPRPLTPRFIAFIAGSFAAILLSASLIDPDLFLHFEITPHRTVLFYLGIFGTILAVSRGMVPEENLVFDPETTLREVVWWTHYLPAGWKGRLHSKMVRCDLFASFLYLPSPFFLLNTSRSILLPPKQLSGLSKSSTFPHTPEFPLPPDFGLSPLLSGSYSYP